MKYLLCFFLLPLLGLAQQDFGENATWYYSFGSNGYQGFKKVQHIDDTLVDGINWLRFELSGKRQIRTGPGPNDLIQDTAYYWPDLFLGTRNDSVFRLLNGNPYLLYDFNAAVGDAWQFAPHDTFGACPDWPIATVVAKGIDTLDGVPLSYMDLVMPMDTLLIFGQPNFQISSSAYLQQRVYRKIGSLQYNSLFEATPNLCNGSSFKLAQLASHNLRCYSDAQVSVNTGANPCDQWSNIGLPELSEKNVWVYPNPSSGRIFIEEGLAFKEIEIRNLQGSLLAQYSSGTRELLLPAMPGIYMVLIRTNDGRLLAQKLAKI